MAAVAVPLSAPAPCTYPTERAKGRFPGVHTDLCIVWGAHSWEEGVEEGETETRKEIGRGERSEGDWVCMAMCAMCACLCLSEPVVSVYVHVSVSPREATPSQTDGKGSQTWDL